MPKSPFITHHSIVKSLKLNSLPKRINMTTHIIPTVSCNVEKVPAWADLDKPEFLSPPSRQDKAAPQPPVGFPSSAQGPMVWSREDGASLGSQVLELGPAEIAEVEQAVKHFLGTFKTQHTCLPYHVSGQKHKKAILTRQQPSDWTGAK